MNRILLVDDEPNLVWAVRECLSDEGYEVFVARDGAEALTLARLSYPDLIVLDIVMPHLDGLAVCRALRRDPEVAAVPILFLTGLGAPRDRVMGLDQGGDDYLVKPFDVEELKARIRALLRRSQVAPESAAPPGDTGAWLSVGGLKLDLHTCQVVVTEGGKPGQARAVQLTPIEFDLLYYLMRHPGQVFSSEQLLQRVWGYPPGTADPSLVRWHVKNLRTKIEPDPQQPVHIRTLVRHGYVLNGG